MRANGILTLIVFVLLIGHSFLLLAQQTITVPDDYPTIQAAIDAAQPGDTVYVKAGRYTESLTITKPLHLVGEDRTKVVIQSPDKEKDVITIMLFKGEVEIKELGVSGGDTGIMFAVGEAAQVRFANLICYKNQIGIFAGGSGTFFLTDSYIVENEAAGLVLKITRVQVKKTEVLLGGEGIVLMGAVTVSLNTNIIGLCTRGIDTYTTDCGWQDGEEKFLGMVSGSGNRIYVLDTDTCPEYPGSSWPAGFFDEAWRSVIDKAFASYSRGITLYKDQDYKETLAVNVAGLKLLTDAPFPLLDAYFDQNIGTVYAKLGRYEKALDAFRSARAVFVNRGMDVDVAKIDQNIGIVYWYLGRYGQALTSSQAARKAFDNHSMEVEVARTDQNIGLVYRALGQYEEALARYQDARKVFESHGMDVKVAVVDQNIGAVYYKLGRYGQALTSYQATRKAFDNHSMEVEVAGTDQNIGLVYRALGQYEEALTSYQAAREVYENHGMEVDVAMLDQSIGSVYVGLSRYEEALARFKAAQQIFESHDVEVDVALVAQNVGTVYAKLGRYEEALTSYEEALEILDRTPPAEEMKYSYPAMRWEILSNKGECYEKQGKWKTAVQAYQDSIAVIESLRSYMKSEKIKTAWQQQTQDVYERLIKLLIEHGQGTDAFPYAERCRARTFLDLLAKGPVGTIENVREQGIKTGVVNPEAISNDVQTVIHSLPADTAALEYFVTDKVTYVWVIAHGEVSEPIPIEIYRQDLINKVVAFRQELETTAEGMVLVPPQTLLAKARDLYQVLLKPLEDKLTGIEHVIIIPSGPLFYVPFAALLRCPGCEGHDLYGGKYLVERYSLSYSPSLATLKYALTHTAHPQATFLGLADPDSGDPNIPRLPDAQTEARTVAKLFPVSSVYVDKSATEDVVQSQSATAREVLLSTHGSFNPHNPMHSYLVMSPTSKNKDAKLFAYEVFSLPLHADMVVLSACETLLPSLEKMTDQLNRIARRAGDNETKELTEDQLKELTAGDEVVGLTRAFISAGASSVLSSLWSVPSEATTQLMVSFYKHIEDDGMDKAQALRAAQLEVMNTTGWTQPLYWAAFDLMGDWR